MIFWGNRGRKLESFSRGNNIECPKYQCIFPEDILAKSIIFFDFWGGFSLNEVADQEEDKIEDEGDEGDYGIP